MIICGYKMYRCEISASGRTMTVYAIDGITGLESMSRVLRLSGHGDIVDRYKAVVAKRNRHLDTDDAKRDEGWVYQLQEINDEYNCAVDALLRFCRVHRWA